MLRKIEKWDIGQAKLPLQFPQFFFHSLLSLLMWASRYICCHVLTSIFQWLMFIFNEWENWDLMNIVVVVLLLLLLAPRKRWENLKFQQYLYIWHVTAHQCLDTWICTCCNYNFTKLNDKNLDRMQFNVITVDSIIENCLETSLT